MTKVSSVNSLLPLRRTHAKVQELSARRLVVREKDSILWDTLGQFSHLLMADGAFTTIIVAIHHSDGQLSIVDCVDAETRSGTSLPPEWEVVLTDVLQPQHEQPESSYHLAGGGTLLAVIRVIPSDGSRIVVLGRTMALVAELAPRRAQLSVVATIIADGIQARQDHHQRQGFLDALGMHLRESVTVLDAHFQVLYASTSMQRAFGCDEAELESLSMEEISTRIHQEDLPALRAMSDQLINDPATVHALDCRVKHVDGSGGGYRFRRPTCSTTSRSGG